MSMFKTPPGAKRNGARAESGAPASPSPARALDLEDTQQEMQEELSKHGLNDPGATHKALDIELGQVHKQVAKLDLELQALKDNPMLAPATAETLDKLGSAAFTELPATTK